MPMTPALMKEAIVTSLGVSGITVEDEAALLAISKAIVEYIQANATISDVTVDPTTHIQVPETGAIS